MKKITSITILSLIISFSLSAQKVTDSRSIRQNIIGHKYEDVNKKVVDQYGNKCSPYIWFQDYNPMMDGEVALTNLVKPKPGTNGGIYTISSTGKITVTGANGSTICFYLLTDGRIETTYNGEKIYLKQVE